MNPEIYYYTLSSFGKSITKNLKKIDEELLQAINETQEHPKRVEFPMGMMEVLKSYVKINYLAEDALKNLQINLANLQRETNTSTFALTKTEPPEADFAERNEVGEIPQTTEAVTKSEDEPPQKIIKNEPLTTSQNFESSVKEELPEPSQAPKIVEEVIKSDTSQTNLKSPRNKTLKKKLRINANDSGKEATVPEPQKIYKIQDDKLAADQMCTFCHVESPLEFYVRTNQKLFESFQVYLNNDLNCEFQDGITNFKSKQEAKSIIGNFAFSYFEDKQQWVRVEVLDWLMDIHPKEILIQLVDYGDKYLSQYEYLKSGVTAFYAEFPKLAIKCHFAANGVHSWPQDSINSLIELSEMDKRTEFLVIYANKQGNSYSVDLAKSKNDKTISEILIEKHLARQQLETEEYDDISGANTYGLCPRTLPVEGDSIQIVLTGYKTTCHFYGQILSYGGGIPNNYNADFDKLLVNMNSCSTVQTYIPFPKSPKIGTILIARHNEYWYRAKCLGIEPDDFKIFLVDYGKIVNTQMSDLRQIKDDFLHVPFQAVEFMLDDVVEESNISLSQSWGFFKMVMSFKEFKAEVLQGNTEPIRIKMYDGKGLDMSYVLENCGFAKVSCKR